jgi:hypothetical protein
MASLQLALSSPGSAEEHPLRAEGVRTNLGVAHELLDQVARQSLDAMAAAFGAACLHAQPGTQHSANPLVEIAFAQAGREAGLRVAAEPEACAQRLEFRLLELRIAYTGIDRSALGFKKEIERYGSCVLASRVLDAESGEELASTQQEVVLADRFPYDLESLLRSDSYAFTAPELKERDWSKAAEPIVVTALISGLIFLFFSNQSGE